MSAEPKEWNARVIWPSDSCMVVDKKSRWECWHITALCEGSHFIQAAHSPASVGSILEVESGLTHREP